MQVLGSKSHHSSMAHSSPASPPHRLPLPPDPLEAALLLVAEELLEDPWLLVVCTSSPQPIQSAITPAASAVFVMFNSRKKAKQRLRCRVIRTYSSLDEGAELAETLVALA